MSLPFISSEYLYIKYASLCNATVVFPDPADP